MKKKQKQTKMIKRNKIKQKCIITIFQFQCWLKICTNYQNDHNRIIFKQNKKKINSNKIILFSYISFSLNNDIKSNHSSSN